MPNYLMLALNSALSVFGIRSIYEQPRYEVTERIGAVEIRARCFTPTLHNPVFAPERGGRAGSDARLGRAAAGKSAPASSMHSEHLPVHRFEPQHRLELWRKQCNAVSW